MILKELKELLEEKSFEALKDYIIKNEIEAFSVWREIPGSDKYSPSAEDMEEYKELIMWLIEDGGLNPRVMDWDFSRDFWLVKLLVEYYGFSIDSIGVVAEDNVLISSMISEHCSIEQFKKILSYSPDINKAYGVPPLLYAIRDGLVPYARLLIEYGANIDFLRYDPIVLKTWLQYPKMMEMLISYFPHTSGLKAEPPQKKVSWANYDDISDEEL